MKKLFITCTVALSVFLLSGAARAVTNIKGLTVLVNYTDYKHTATTAQIDPMMNQASGYTGWGNVGSVSQYYSVQTNGNIVLNNQVISVNLANTFNYYQNGGNLVVDVVNAINAKYPSGFTGLTSYPTENRLWMFVLLCAAPNGAGVTYGFGDNVSIKNNGVALPIQTVSVTNIDLAYNPGINTICHELGHHLFGWTDYYDIYEEHGRTNLGHYCLMGSGGNHTCPMPIDAGLRYLQGWIGTVTSIDNNTTKTYTVTSNSRTQVFKYANKANAKEYYLIESFVIGGYYVAVDGDGYVPDQGLAIWYVDEEGGLNKPVDPVQFPKIKLVQADGLDEMHDTTKTHHDWRGDDTDLFDNTYSSFSDAAYPKFRWKDGSESGLLITNISAVGATMTFKVNARPYTITATNGDNGTMSESGLVSVTKGQSKTFTFVPDINYVISKISVNGSSKGTVSSYTFSSISANQTISATYKYSSSVDALPSPWKKIDIGTPSAAGKSGYRNGTFRIETVGTDIYNNSDDFHYVYQSLSGDGEIVAHVAAHNEPREWCKSGVMIRESLAPDSKYAMFVKAVWDGAAMQWRTNTAGSSDNQNNEFFEKFNWVKLKRMGNTFYCYISDNGLNWGLFSSVSVAMQSNVYIGLCATGSTANLGNKSLFDNVKVTIGSPLARMEEEEQNDMVHVPASSDALLAAPNPFSHSTTLLVPESVGEATMTVTNASGHLVEQRPIAGRTSVGETYPSGIYFVQIKNNQVKQQFKIIKQ
jgi:M6 family metalloprotease-like protein